MLKKLIWGKRIPRKVVFVTGLFTILYPVYDCSYALVTHNIIKREPVNLKDRYGQDTVAVVAGATSSTGFAICEKLKSQGFKLVIVDSDESKLEKVAQQLGGAATFVFDWKTQTNWQEYERLCNEISSQGEVSILVNAVEQFDKEKGKIHKTEDKDLIQTLNANTFPVVFMTRFLGPKLRERSTGDKKSAIINLTSYYTEWPAFNAPLFSAGKSFSDCVSQVVGYENQNMDVLTVKGMPVKSKRNPEGVLPEDLVDGIFLDLGHERVSYGAWQHSMFRHYILWQQCDWWNSQTPRGPKKSCL